MSPTIVWSKTIKALCYNVISGIGEGKFICPVFGTTHELPEPGWTSKNQPIRIFSYRGYNYYLKKIHYSTTGKIQWAFGLYCPEIDDSGAILCPIMFISNDMGTRIHLGVCEKFRQL